MSELAKRAENGILGETLTAGILMNKFWVLRRSVDIEGADLLIQEQADTAEELFNRKMRIQVYGIAQSKFFELHNAVRIDKKYVEDDRVVERNEFFAFLHTRDDQDENPCYFFTAKEIQNAFTDDGTHYRFAITKERTYEQYRRRNKGILRIITDNLASVERERNEEFVRRLYREVWSKVQNERQTVLLINGEPTGKSDVTVEMNSGIRTVKRFDPVTGTDLILNTSLAGSQSEYEEVIERVDPLTGVVSVESITLKRPKH